MTRRKLDGPNLGTRLATGLACVGICVLALMALPASRPQPVDPPSNPEPSAQLAFADEADVVDPAASPTTVSPTTVSPTTVSPTTVAPAKRPRPGRVLLVGDSIAHETRVPLTERLATKDIALDSVTFPGLAPCDLYDPAAETATARPPDVVILLFTGNAISPCMSNANDPSTQPYFQKYRADMTAMVELFPATTDVWVVEPLPYAKESTNDTVARLDEIFQSISGVDGVIPIRDLFTTPAGDFSTTLDCLSSPDTDSSAENDRVPGEPCPLVRVRAADGVHLGDDDSDNQFGRTRMAFGFDRFLDNHYE